MRHTKEPETQGRQVVGETVHEPFCCSSIASQSHWATTLRSAEIYSSAMRSIVINIVPFLFGALVGIVFGTGVTRIGSLANFRYRILELDPMARNLALAGLLLLGAGLGGTFAAVLKSAGDGDIEFSPARDQKFLWQIGFVTGFLVFAGFIALAIGVYILG